MLKLTDTETGHEYEVMPRGEPKHKGYYLTADGRLGLAIGDTNYNNATRHILTPILKRHVFGGVEFEETGERRGPRDGEWYITYQGDVSLWADADGHVKARTILRPVALK